ncbi:MAG: flagellar FlbD family protein [Planctomycetota bacterium]
MIRLRRLNGKAFLLNADLIKFIEETPDTVVTLINGERVVVAEDIEEVVERVVDYERRRRAFSVD